MANLPETPQWEEGVYQIEVSDPVLGGPDGISNRPAKQLASRTSYLKQQVEKGGSDLAKHIAAADPHTQYAPKASPTFTGTPTAPTPAANDNSKKLVTTEFVARAIAALAGTAPETLDTLKELADALGNDPNFATTVLNKLAEKLAKDQNGADIPDPALFVKNLGLGSGLTGVVGAAINARMSVTAPSATATFTADELIVGVALGGLQYRLGSFNKTINLATTGAGGMDTGTAPVSGYVALYAIYNPTTAASAMLAVNATAAVAPQVYGGANMPAGYTASALISVWPTSSGSQFLTGSQVNRNINTSPTRAVLATSTQYPAGSTISIATLVPPNAVLVSGSFILTSSETSLMSGLISSDSQRSGEQGMTSTVQAFSAVSSSFSKISIPTSRMAGISLTSSAGTPSFSIYITCYTF